MLKIFTTQLQGVFNRIGADEDFALEDGARLLAQAVVGEGHIYIHGVQEMKAIEAEAINGAEPLRKAAPLSSLDSYEAISETDRVLIVSRFSTDEEAVQTAKAVQSLGIEMVAISTALETEQNGQESLTTIADVHIDMKLKKALIPSDVGERYGFPSSMAALFAYYGLAFTIKEILDEQDDESLD